MPATQLYAHLDGDRWDYLVIWPITTPEQDRKLDELDGAQGAEDRLPGRARVPGDAGLAHRHLRERPHDGLGARGRGRKIAQQRRARSRSGNRNSLPPRGEGGVGGQIKMGWGVKKDWPGQKRGSLSAPPADDRRPRSAGNAQYIPPMPPPPCRHPRGRFSFSSGISETRASVVSSSDAIDAAFCSAERTTLVGSMTPASTRFSYFSVRALKPSSRLHARAPWPRPPRPRGRRCRRSGAAAPRARGG